MSLDLLLKPVATTAFTEAALQGLLNLGLALLDTLPERPPRCCPQAPAPRTSPLAPSQPPLQVSWTRGTGDAETKLWKAAHNGEPWIARVTRVADIPYDALRHSLMVDKTATEQAALLAKGDEITVEADGGRRFGDITVLDVHKLLHVQAFSAREFLETIVSRDLPPLQPQSQPHQQPLADRAEQPEGGRPQRSCIVVSVPRQGALKDTAAHAHGVYVSVETVRELEDGTVEVITACSSDAGGSIPRWVQNIAMAGQILGDGQKFFKFVREQQRR